MTDTKFTPAPWKTDLDYDAIGQLPRIYGNGKMIAEVGNAEAWQDASQEWEANANLISAAPDMYEAIARFLPNNINLDNSNISSTNIVPLDIPYGELRCLYRALKKARGE